MKNPFKRNPFRFYNVEENTKKDSPSSRVQSSRYIGWIEPMVHFEDFYELYYTMTKIQNTIDKITHSIITRDWYFDSKIQANVDRMNEFERKHNLSRIIQYYVYDSLITGNFMLSKSDWQPVQMSSIIGCHRDDYGRISEYGHKLTNGVIEPFSADLVWHERFIEIDRQAWGIGLLNSLATRFIDIDGDSSIPTAHIMRQLEQDFAKIIHRLGSPRVLYAFDNLDDEQLKSEALKLGAMKAGHRGVINQRPEFITETIDSRSRFPEYVEFIKQNFDVGTQSATNRLLTQPSAMADGRVATEANDNELTLGIMERIRRFMDFYVIPEVLGVDDACTFNWGAKDSFEVVFPPGLGEAVRLGVVLKVEARDILRSKAWKLRDDSEFLKEQEKQQQMMQQKGSFQLGSSSNDKKDEPQKDAKEEPEKKPKE